MHNKVITIVGGTGFLGRYVVKLLAAQGWQLRVIARDIQSALHLKTAGDVGQITLVSGDITDRRSLEGKLDRSYAVINLVGILHEKGRHNFTSSHATGAATLAQLAKTAGAERFIQISALGAANGSPSRYASTKAAGEQAVKLSFPEATILRPGLIFGAEDNFFNRFAAMITLLPVFPLIGGGKSKFQPVYVMDVAQAVFNALARPETAGKTYELGGPGTYSFRELMEFISRTIGRRSVFIPVPFAFAKIAGLFAQLLPNPPLTKDQAELLKYDNLVAKNAGTLRDLGIRAQSVENIAPLYLARFAKKLA